VWWLGAHDANGAQAAISVDGGSSVLVDESAGMSKNDATVEGVPLYGVTGLDGTKSHTIQVSWAANGALTGGYLSVYGFMFVSFDGSWCWTLLIRSFSYDNSPGQQTTTPNTPVVTQPAATSQPPTNANTDTAAPDTTNPPSSTAGDTSTATAVTTPVTSPAVASSNGASSPTRNGLAPTSSPVTSPVPSSAGTASKAETFTPRSGSASVVVSNGQTQTQMLFTSGSVTLTQVVSVGTTVVNGQTQTQTATMLAGSAGSAGASGLAGAAGASGSNGKGATSNAVLIGGVVGGVVGGALAAVLLTLLILYLRRQRRRHRKRDHGTHLCAQSAAVRLTVSAEYRPGPPTAERSQASLMAHHASSTGAVASTDALAPPRRGSPSPSDVSTNMEGFWLAPISPWSPGGRPPGAPAAPVGAFRLGPRPSGALASQFALTNPDSRSDAGGSTTDAGTVSDSLVSELAPPPPGVFPATKLYAVSRARVLAGQAVRPEPLTRGARHPQLAPARPMSTSLSVADEVPPPVYSER
jgi:hypothetical protein